MSSPSDPTRPTRRRKAAIVGLTCAAFLGGTALLATKSSRSGSPAGHASTEADPASPTTPAVATAELDPVPPIERRADRCDGEDDDHDGTVDEDCPCKDGFALDYPPVPFLRPHEVVSGADGAALLIGLGGVSRYDGQRFTTVVPRRNELGIRAAWVGGERAIVLDDDDQLVAIEGDRIARIGAITSRRTLEVHSGERFEDALAVVDDVLVGLAPSVQPIPGIPEGVESVYGDRRGFVSVSYDGTVHHGRGTELRSSRLEGAPPDDVYLRSPDDVFVVASDHRVSHWDGTRWTVLLTRPRERLELVTGAPGVVFVHGHDLTTEEHRVHRYDGRSWTHTEFAAGPVPHSLLVVGGRLHALADRFVRFDDDHYEPILATYGAWLRDIDGASPSSLFVVGNRGTVLHGDGHGFRPIRAHDSIEFVDVHAVSDDLAIAVGSSVSADPRSRSPIAMRCDRQGCADLPLLVDALEPTAVWADGTSIVVGTRQGHVFSSNGGPWLRVASFEAEVTSIVGRGMSDLRVTLATREPDTSNRGRVGRLASLDLDPQGRSSQDLAASALLPDGRLVVGGGNEGYVESGSDLFLLGGARPERIRVGDPNGAMELSVVDDGILSLGRTHPEVDAGDRWGSDSWVLRAHVAGRTQVVARDALHGGYGLFASSPRNVYVVGTDSSILHRCGPTSVFAAPGR